MPRFYEKYWEGDASELGDFGLKWPILSRFIPHEEGVVILDFGCGKGHILSQIFRLNPKATYVGLDVSETALIEARRACPWATFHAIEDGGSFPIADGSIDFVMTSEVIEHVYDTENAFAELARIVKHGGKVVMTTPHHGFWKNLALVFFGFEQHFDPFGSHVRFFTKRNLCAAFVRHGFTITHIDHYGRFVPFSHSILVVAEKQ